MRHIAQLLKKRLTTLLGRIPLVSYQRIAHQLQNAGGTLFVAGLIGFAVTGDSITPEEAQLLIVTALTIFFCGTILDIALEQKTKVQKTRKTEEKP